MLVSHLDLRDGAWPVLGPASDWDPAGGRWSSSSGASRVRRRPRDLYAVRWDEETLNEEESDAAAGPGRAGSRPPDVLSGARRGAELRRVLGV